MVAIGARSIWEPAVIGLIGGVFGCMEEQQGRLAPQKSELIRLWRTTRTGQSTGSTALDAIAADRPAKVCQDAKHRSGSWWGDSVAGTDRIRDPGVALATPDN